MDPFEIENTFDALISPIYGEAENQAVGLDQRTGSKSLFFAQFVRSLLFAFVYQITSLRKLVTELETNATAHQLGLSPIPYSTLQEAFSRFPASAFRHLFMTLLASTTFMAIPELQALGTLYLVDGSLFPTIRSADWAVYKQNGNAIKLHLAFELNRMLAVEFLVSPGNANERRFVQSILQAGTTYIMDRGYMSFDLLAAIVKEEAFFIIRAKENLKFTVTNAMKIGADLPKDLFGTISDALVTLNNDSHGHTYRLVQFSIANTPFIILTNRWELSTFQVILCYAYRWQIELMFRFLKCSLKGLHLFNTSENGVQIQFYMLLITAMLQLKLKQVCATAADQRQRTPDEMKKRAIDCATNDHRSFLKALGQKLHRYWKISCHWLIRLKNSLLKPFNWPVVLALAKP